MAHELDAGQYLNPHRGGKSRAMRIWAEALVSAGHTVLVAGRYGSVFVNGSNPKALRALGPNEPSHVPNTLREMVEQS